MILNPSNHVFVAITWYLLRSIKITIHNHISTLNHIHVIFIGVVQNESKKPSEKPKMEYDFFFFTHYSSSHS